MRSLTEYFADWDPMDFIGDLGAPRDEYSLEASTIASKYMSEMSGKQVGELTYQVFTELIESDYKGFREECFERGAEIKALLDS